VEKEKRRDEAIEMGRFIRLDLNESPFDIPEAVKRSIVSRILNVPFNRYYLPPREAEREPGGMGGWGIDALCERLGEMNGVSPDCILLGNGSDEIILLLAIWVARACGQDGAPGRVVVPVPTFGQYSSAAEAAGARLLEVPSMDDFRFDSEALCRAARDEAPTIVFLCRPNNPTGSSCDLEVVRRLLDTGAMVVVDEAYYEFSKTTVANWLAREQRLFVLRTMSKAWGLAGLRLGYLMGESRFIKELRRIKPVFNIDVVTQAVALQVLSRPELMERAVERIVCEREWLEQRLGEIPGVCILPSETNFILFHTPYPAARVWDGLRSRGVIVRRFESPRLSHHLRVTLGTRRENQAFVDAMHGVIRELGGGDAPRLEVGKGG